MNDQNYLNSFEQQKELTATSTVTADAKHWIYKTAYGCNTNSLAMQQSHITEDYYINMQLETYKLASFATK